MYLKCSKGNEGMISTKSTVFYRLSLIEVSKEESVEGKDKNWAIYRIKKKNKETCFEYQNSVLWISNR